MRRPVWYRVLIGIWCLWLTTSLSGAGAAAACPMPAAHAALEAASSSAGEGIHAHAAAHHGSSDRNDDSHQTCPCLGLCCCTPSLVAARVPMVFAIGLVLEPSLAVHRDAMVPGVRRAYSQPFGNGPPTSAVL